jgi:2-keto-4-pentenoate hydratase/2-oxohepta-3-ene-1,7-dioic acid hydratase in catechol pathway
VKLGTVLLDGRSRLIAQIGDGAASLDLLYRNAGLGAAPSTLTDLIAGGEPEGRRARQALAEAGSVALLDPDALDWLPPQPQPSKVIGVADDTIDLPDLHLKAPATLLGHGKPILREQNGETVPELAAIVGRRCKDLTDAAARGALYGYSIVNRAAAHGRARATDIGPMGPWITTADEVADPNDLTVEARLDGEPFACHSTADYRFTVEQVVAEASRRFTLEPGDVICFGSAGEAAPGLPRQGVIDIDIEGLGRLTSPVRHNGTN